MWIEFVPLLGALGKVYALPRDRSRFQGYIALVTGGKTDDVELSPRGRWGRRRRGSSSRRVRVGNDAQLALLHTRFYRFTPPAS